MYVLVVRVISLVIMVVCVPFVKYMYCVTRQLGCVTNCSRHNGCVCTSSSICVLSMT